VLESLGLSSVEQIVPWYYEVRKTPFWRARIADLAVAVVRLAEKEADFQAVAILERAAEEMETSLLAAISRAHEQGIITKTGVQPMIVEGGVARNSKYFQNRISGLLKARRLGKWDVKVSKLHPVVGAVAFALSGRTKLPNNNVLAKLQESAQQGQRATTETR
jgi:N-acetylglucosamine kinase-like BadF-type ATPase